MVKIVIGAIVAVLIALTLLTGSVLWALAIMLLTSIASIWAIPRIVRWHERGLGTRWKRNRVDQYIATRLDVDNRERQAAIDRMIDYGPAWAAAIRALENRLAYLFAVDDALKVALKDELGTPTRVVVVDSSRPATREVHLVINERNVTLQLNGYSASNVKLPRTKRGQRRWNAQLPEKILEATHALQAAMSAEEEHNQESLPA